MTSYFAPAVWLRHQPPTASWHIATGPQPRDPRTHQPAKRRRLKRIRKASQRRNRK